MRLKAVALASALLLAGCVGSDEADQAEPEPTPADVAAAEQLAAAQENATYLANEDYVEDHTHDYWNGATRKTLMNEDVAVGRNVFRPMFSAFSQGGFTTSLSARGFTLPNGTFVPEGAGQMEIAVDATGALDNGQVRIGYRAPDASDFTRLEPQGATGAWTIDLTPTMADVPHAKKTRWEFVVEAVGEGASMDGDVHIGIDVVRLHDIAAWPAHPDFWDAGALDRMHLGNTTGSYDYLSQHVIGAEEEVQYVTVTLPDGVIIPPETEALVVSMHYERTEDAKNQLNGPVLLVVKDGATSRGHKVMHGNRIEERNGFISYAIPVDGSSWDSPYATTSGWSWRLHAPMGHHDNFGLGPWIDIGILDVGQGSFDVGIIAFRIVPPWLAEVLPDDIGRGGFDDDDDPS